MALEYMIDGEYRQVIAQKINEDFSFPEKIRIERAEFYTFHPKPRKTLWKDGTGKLQRYCSFTPWLKLYDQDGICGEGPVTPAVWSTFLPFMMSIKEAHTNLEWRQLLYWKERGGMSHEIGMIETILFDIISKKRGIPMHTLLGAKRNWCDCYKGGGSVLLSDEQLLEEVLSFKEEGFQATKIKISLCEYERDVRRLYKLREALGPDFSIAIDSNQAWDAETCMKFLKDAYDVNIAFWEEPIVHTQTAEITKLISQMRESDLYVPLAYGESARGMWPVFEAYMNAGVEIIQPTGMGYTLAEGLRIADYARSHGHKITSGQNHMGCLFGTLLEPGEMIEFHRPNVEGREEYYLYSPTLKNGKMHLPDVTGLPIAMNLDKLKAEGCLSGIQYCSR